MRRCVSGVTRWGDKKMGGWREKGDEEDEESMPMLSQEQTWTEEEAGARDTETDEDSEEEVLVRNIGVSGGNMVIQS